jgi:hypothetical protein
MLINEIKSPTNALSKNTNHGGGLVANPVLITVIAAVEEEAVFEAAVGTEPPRLLVPSLDAVI